MTLWAHSTSSFKWPSLRSCPSVIRFTPRISFRTDPVPYCFIKDLQDNVRSSDRLFADNCVLNNFILQKDLTSLEQWHVYWQMKFNVAKCHSMRVTRHQHHKQILFDYSIYNQTLKNVQSAEYLGITISDNMDWGQHISEISSKATKTLGYLHRNFAFAPRSTKEVAYKTFVWPKLENAAPIWRPY